MRLGFAATLLVLLRQAPLEAQTDAAKSFDQTIAPILNRWCLECHSGAKPKGDLNLTRRALLLEGGNKGPALVPGHSGKSLFWELIDQGKMPPKKNLPAADKEKLRAWIDAGAPWGTEPIDPFRFSTEQRAGYDWWSLQPVKKPVPPKVSEASWASNPIDQFILARLQEKGLKPSPPAAPRVLLRRLYFDLIGLPPTPDEIQAFEKEASKNPQSALENVVNHLLASPHYGERWARHWLDVVRYGESDGFERNMPRATAWPYRDWVVKALNDDIPFDEFARLQIAGDVLRPGDPEAVSATGFLVAGIHNTVVGSNEAMRQTARHDELEDLTATLGQAFLGLTVHCARCHDHKFDPVSQKDYYRLVASLVGVEHGERKVFPTDRTAKEKVLQEKLKVVHKQLADLEQTALAKLRQEKKQPVETPLPVAPLARWTFAKNTSDVIGALHGKLQGEAALVNGRLKLNGKNSLVKTAPLQHDLSARTLEVWTTLATLQQGGGGVMTIETLNGGVFDSIVFAERQPRKWMAGSNFFQRTRDLAGPEEKAPPGELVHVAIAYHSDGRIALYRNGEPYGVPYLPPGAGANLQTYKAGQAQVLFGLRHTGGGNGSFVGEIEEARLYDRALNPQEVVSSFRAGPGAQGVSLAELLKALPPEDQKRHESLSTQRRTLEQSLQKLPGPMAMYVVNPIAPAPMHVLARGDVQKKLERVAAGGVVALSNADFGLGFDAPEGERRKKLAEWITRPDNPLFTRVIVNRLWHHHFGVGLVETPSDFGFNGGRPSHPELLDWLAAELAQRKFSLKALHRLLVTSSTYQQSSRGNPAAMKIDAGNRLLWRKSPQRLEGEALRDAILTVSGQLNTAQGGPGYHDVRTYHNSGTTYYEPIDPVGKNFERRTLYRFAPRGERNALLDSFDCPDPSATTPRRQVTTTPLQALSLLNSAFVLRMADKFAQRIDGETKDVSARVRRAYQLALGRLPSATESRLADEFVERHGLPALCRVLFNSNEFVVVE